MTQRPPINPRDILKRAMAAVDQRQRGRILALQGGGALGAFTYGVLDTLLEKDDRPLAALSGASAGALNAAVLATGLARGGKPKAQEALAAFWDDVARGGAFAEAMLLPSRMLGFQARKPARGSGDILRQLIERHIDVEALRSPEAPRLFISATHVQSGHGRIFTNRELSHDVLAASACLPFLQPAIVIDGEAYWDGGFTHNPPLKPLIPFPGDILLVRLLSTGTAAVPTKVSDIDRHLKAFAFAAPLARELDGIGPALERVREIALEDNLPDQSIEALPTPKIVEQRKEAGQEAASRFLAGEKPVRPSVRHRS